MKNVRELTNEQANQDDCVANEWAGRQENGVRLTFGQCLVMQYQTGNCQCLDNVF